MIINKEENKFEESILHKEKEVAQALFMTEKESKDIEKFYYSSKKKKKKKKKEKKRKKEKTSDREKEIGKC